MTPRPGADGRPARPTRSRGDAPLRELLRGLLDLVLPPLCAACGADAAAGAALCAACDAGIPRPPPLPAAPPPLSAWRAGVEFRGAAEDWIRRFKYPRPGLAGLDPAAGAVVRGWIREAARAAAGPAPDLLVPVPLHPRRLRERGFNPAALLARAAARELGVAWDARALERRRDTPSQTGLGRGARRRNVRGAFAPRRSLPACVWLVDDVVTTGSTLVAAARAARAGGARRLAALCAAWTPGDC